MRAPTAGSHRPCSLGILGSYCVQARSSTVRSTAGHWSLAMRRYHFHAPCCTQWYINYCVAIRKLGGRWKIANIFRSKTNDVIPKFASPDIQSGIASCSFPSVALLRHSLRRGMTEEWVIVICDYHPHLNLPPSRGKKFGFVRRDCPSPVPLV